MEIVENILPETIQTFIEDFCLDQNFLWTFLKDTAYSDKSDYPSFGHMAIDGFHPVSSMASIFEVPITMINETFKLDRKKLFRERFGLYMPLSNRPVHNNPHVDLDDKSHTVVLYYVNDSDGDTFFFDENMNIEKRITPKRGKAVMFDGSIFHASSMPSKKPRITLNLNYLK